MRGARIRTLALALAGVSATGLATPFATAAHAQDANRRAFNIPAQEMAGALETFGRQSGRDILFDRGQVAGLRSIAIRGSLQPDAALRRLVGGSGLSVTAPNANTFVVGRSPGEVAAGSAPADEESAEQTIVVTGSNIRGRTPAGADLQTITRRQIDEAGYLRATDALAQVPSNFPGVNRELGPAGNFNTNYGTEVQIRGLGSGTTLTLLDGHRLPQGGILGNFTDISLIPFGAVQRIEILKDGASAVYGSDAMAGVVNFVLYRDYRGVELRGRLAMVEGGAVQGQASVTAGTSWSSGSVLVALEYTTQDPILATDRPTRGRNIDLRPLGGTDFRQTGGAPGTIISPGTFAIPPGSGVGLRPSDFVPNTRNFRNTSERLWLVPHEDDYSAFIRVRQDLSEHVEVELSGMYARRESEQETGGIQSTVTVPNTNPFYVNPTGGTGPVRVTYNFIHDLGPTTFSGVVEQFGATGSATVQLPSSWRLRVSGQYGREDNLNFTRNNLNSSQVNLALADTNPATALNVFGSGGNNNPATLDRIRQTAQGQSRSDLTFADIIVDGPIAIGPGLVPSFAFGASYRRDSIRRSTTTITATATTVLDQIDASANAYAAFGELSLPITFGDGTGFFRGADISAAARYDRYNDVIGDTLNPKLGVSLRLAGGLSLRGTWGTSFRAPPIFRTRAIPNITPELALPAVITDPTTNQPVNALLFQAIRPLKPERSEFWGVGLTWRPPFYDEASFTVSYYNINYRDKFGSADTILPFRYPTAYADVFTRNPSQAQVDAICNAPFFGGGSCANIAVIIDLSLANLAVLNTDGIDFEVALPFQTSFGRFVLGANATYVLNYELAPAPGAPPISVLNTVGNPLRFRGVGSLNWTYDRFFARVAVSYNNDYRDISFTPTREVETWIPVDFSFGVRIGGAGDDSSPSRLQLSVSNLFNELPPLVNNSLSYDRANASLQGRVVSLQLSTRF